MSDLPKEYYELGKSLIHVNHGRKTHPFPVGEDEDGADRDLYAHAEF